MLNRIISGGQTGADIGGLAAAKSMGVLTGGYMPKGWMTEEGPHPEYHQLYNMQESFGGLSKRTQDNISHSDGTVIFATDWASPGTVHTLKHLAKSTKLAFKVPAGCPLKLGRDTAMDLVGWIISNKIQTLNVAGNRESKSPGIGAWVYEYMRTAIGFAVRMHSFPPASGH